MDHLGSPIRPDGSPSPSKEGFLWQAAAFVCFSGRDVSRARSLYHCEFLQSSRWLSARRGVALASRTYVGPLLYVILWYRAFLDISFRVLLFVLGTLSRRRRCLPSERHAVPIDTSVLGCVDEPSVITVPSLRLSAFPKAKDSIRPTVQKGVWGCVARRVNNSR